MQTNEKDLGGRLPLLSPGTITVSQRTIYDLIDLTLIPWAEQNGFTGKLPSGEFVGPFNPFLFSPDISRGFLKFQEAESKFTNLDRRTRQVIILTIGAIWKSKYELYAHTAAALKDGLSKEAVAALASGETPNELTPSEMTAHRYAMQLCKEHRVDDGLYREAELAFGHEGLVNLTYLVGVYLFTCALLNGFEIPVPQDVTGLNDRAEFGGNWKFLPWLTTD